MVAREGTHTSTTSEAVLHDSIPLSSLNWGFSRRQARKPRAHGSRRGVYAPIRRTHRLIDVLLVG